MITKQTTALLKDKTLPMMLAQSKEAVNNTRIDFPMTRERYLATWKIFRAISDENALTANHLLSLDSWHNISSILDLGCGDGLVTKHIVIHSPQTIQQVILVDPDKEMVDEAEMHLKELNIVPEIIKEHSPFETCFLKYVQQVDMVLGVHLVYLISRNAFHFLMENLPIGKKMIVVLDDETSVFTKLWNRTATKYVERSAYARNYFENLPTNAFKVTKSVVSSCFKNPLTQRGDIKDALLSLMSYSDYQLMDSASKNFVENCIADNIIDNHIECKSACYEIVKIA